MFRKKITATPLTTDTANDYFNNITGSTYQSDISFLATLRALVAPRIKDDESITLQFGNSSYSTYVLEDAGDNSAMGALCVPSGNGEILIHHFSNSEPEHNTSWMNFVERKLIEIHPGWHRLDKVTEFYRKTFNVICFINPDKKSVAIFTDNLNMRTMHYLQVSIAAFLPWYIDPEKGLTEDEMSVVKSLREKSSEQYEVALLKIAENYDFKTERVKKMLAGFENRYQRVECDRIKNRIENIINNINDYNRKIGDYLAQKNEQEIQLLGLQARIAESSEESEIMDYFLCNDKLSLESVTESEMTFVVKAYCEFYDEDMARSIIENRSSYVYRPNGRGCNNCIQAEDMEKLMSAIFINQTLKLRLCAAYNFDLRGSVNAVRGYTYGIEYRNYTPNTHIDKYSCLGNYSRAITELLVKHDYIGAIEQCAASCRSLNFGDSTVMQEFMNRLYGISDDDVNICCIELPDGSVVEPKQAIEWLKAQEESKDE